MGAVYGGVETKASPVGLREIPESGYGGDAE